ncbi:MAG TPA: hypothetical protein VFN23_16375 [Ktedonobacteraceae bacterium]|nr:hypothetical protein [Ktedonobacteraceae bacterium]
MSRQSGIVIAELLEMKATQPDRRWQAHLYCVGGKVVASHISNNSDGKVLLVNEEAMQWLTGCNQSEFAWKLKALSPQETYAMIHSRFSAIVRTPPPPSHPITTGALAPMPTPQPPYAMKMPAAIPTPTTQPLRPTPTPPPVKEGAIPQRHQFVDQSEMDFWPRNHRRVLGLVDGKRSVDKISGILKLPNRVVEEILHDLKKLEIS